METNSERRRRKLAELCAERGLKAVAKRAGLNWAALDQIIKKTPLPQKKDGTRNVKNLGDDAARRIEEHEGLGKGWFDSGAETAAMTAALYGVDPSAAKVAAKFGVSEQDSTQKQPLSGESIASVAIDNEFSLEQSLHFLARCISASPSKGSDALAGTLVSLSKDPSNPMYTDMLVKMLQPPVQLSVSPKLKQLLSAKVQARTSDFAAQPPTAVTPLHEPPA